MPLSIDGNEAAAGRTGPRFAQAFRRAGAAGLRRPIEDPDLIALLDG